MNPELLLNLFFVAAALLLTALTLPGTILLTLLTIGGAWPVRRDWHPRAPGRLAIVVPAHNESAGILRTLANLSAAARDDADTEVIVIADNCTDDTAAVAAGAGVRVLERNDPAQRGKGYALDFAFRTLLAEDFAFFIVVDADSTVDDGFLAAMRRGFQRGERVLQARYGVLDAGTAMRGLLFEVALAAFNMLRPRGREALGQSVGLLGNGFGLRRDVLEQIPYSAGSVVEDLEYHLLLIHHDIRVAFVDGALVRGAMATGGKGAKTQRSRWEGGRLRMMAEHAGPLARDVLRGRLAAIEPLADLLLLPLSYHVLLLVLLAAVPLDWARLLGLGGLVVVALYVCAAFVIGHLGWRHAVALLLVPFYLIWKVLMIPATLASARRGSAWVRTDREP